MHIRVQQATYSSAVRPWSDKGMCETCMAPRIIVPTGEEIARLTPLHISCSCVRCDSAHSQATVADGLPYIQAHLTTPALSDLPYPYGEPIANTDCPTLKPPDVPTLQVMHTADCVLSKVKT
jgi:hypothetical protein